MKKVISTLVFLSVALLGFSQATYYWVGGSSGTWSSANSWNTQLNGSGSNRATANNADVLIFDGTNIGGSTPTTGTVTPSITSSYTIAQLKLQNAADVVIQRAGGAGTSTLTIAGDGTTADDFTIDASSTFKLTAGTSGYNFVVLLGATSVPITTAISGTVNILDGGLGAIRIASPNANTLQFLNGSVCNVNNSGTSSYPFGSSSQGVAGGVVFKSGSSMVYKGGNNPFANSTYVPAIFEDGSTLIMEAANPAGMFTNRVFSNVTVRNNATVTLAENFYQVKDLTINAGSAFYTRVSGTAPVSGNIVNNGTFGAASGYTSAHLILNGSTPQTISGTGTFGGFGAVSVATDADVTVNTNLTVGASGSPTSTITGKLNMQGYTFSGTGNVLFRSAGSVSNTPGTLTTGSHIVTLNAALYATSNVSIGALVTGAGIAPNSYIIATSSTNFQFTMSKPATATTATDAAAITITNNPTTIITSNAGGLDAVINTTGSKSFGSTTNYVFNAATATPFPTGVSLNARDVTFNANVTTNGSVDISGTLTLNAGKLTIDAGDTIRIMNGNAIAGAPFSSARYIATAISGSTVGILRIDGFTAATLFPVGSTTNYLPVTLTPSANDSFAVSVFEGITLDGSAGGTAMSSAQKQKVVDAVWNIRRISNETGNCTVAMQWPAALEGSLFSGYGSNIGVSRYDGTTWTVVSGGGDNTANTASSIFNAFSPFAVGELNTVLPVRFTSIKAVYQQGKNIISWQVQQDKNADTYSIERSANGNEFTGIGNVVARTGAVMNYVYNDEKPLAGISYYRIKASNTDGSIQYSNIVAVDARVKGSNELSVYPNPVKAGSLNLQLKGMDKAAYSLRLIDNAGSTVFTYQLGNIEGNQSQNIALPQQLKGMYRLVVQSATQTLVKAITID